MPRQIKMTHTLAPYSKELTALAAPTERDHKGHRTNQVNCSFLGW